MFDSATARVALGIGDPDRIGAPSLPLRAFELSTFNFQLLTSFSPTFQRFNMFCPIFFIFIGLRTLLHLRKTQLFCFHALPHSFPKTPGGGGTASRARCALRRVPPGSPRGQK